MPSLNNNFKIPNLTKNMNPTNNFSFTNLITNKKIDELIPNISHLNLSKSNLHSTKSASKIEESSNTKLNNWHVDLTKALRNITSLPQLRPKPKLELANEDNFTLQFVDCETSDENIEPEIMHISDMVDMRWILNVESVMSKKPSRLGRALSSKCKRFDPYFIQRNTENAFGDIKIFLFDTPSPDDVISKHLRK